jgi:hypothetical protein
MGGGGAIDTTSGSISSVAEERMDVDLDGENEEMVMNGVDERMKKMKENFRFSVSTHLFGWDELLRLRMRLSLADFAWVRCGSFFFFLRNCAFSAILIPLTEPRNSQITNSDKPNAAS